MGMLQIMGLQRQAEAKVNQLEPRKLALYKELMQRANALQVLIYIFIYLFNYINHKKYR